MTFKMVLLPPDIGEGWPDKIRRAVPGVQVEAFGSPAAAQAAIIDADAAYGTVPRDLLARAARLRWIAAPRAGLGGEWFYDELVRSPVVVTNLRGIYNDHLAQHIMAFVLAFARRLDRYLPQQQAGAWKRGEPMLDLAKMSALVVGVGGAGCEAARLCPPSACGLPAWTRGWPRRPPGWRCSSPLIVWTSSWPTPISSS